MKSRRAAARSLAISFLLVLGACGGGGSLTARLDDGHGTVSVFLTDAPVDLTRVQSVRVTLTGVIIYPETGAAGSGPLEADGAGPQESPIVLMSRPVTFDLLTLTGGATALIATEEVPAGRYSRIRLQISDASMQLRQSTATPLRLESQKVDIPIHFRVNPDAETGITLDFDAAASVQVSPALSGDYILRPVITPKPGSA